MMEHLVGYIIIAATLLIVIGFIILREVGWAKRKPDKEYRGVRYRYQEGAVEWDDLHRVIDVIKEMTPEAGEFWLEIVAAEEAIHSDKIPTGYINPSGYPTPEPKTEAEAEVASIINGTIDFEKKYPIGSAQAIVYIRQIRDYASKIDARLRRNGGDLHGAIDSALFHEVAQHLLPYRKGQGSNPYHNRQDLAELTQSMKKRFDEI